MRTLLVLLVYVVVSSVASAGLLDFGVQATGGGIAVADPYKDVFGEGFGGGAHLDFNFIPVVSVRVSGDYVSFSADVEKYKAALGTQGVAVPAGVAVDLKNITILALSVNGKLGLPTPVLSPYLTAGVGSATLSGGDGTVTLNGQPVVQSTGVKNETVMSANLGAGVDWKLILTLYFEVKYTIAFTTGNSSSFALASLGITF